MSIRSTIFSLNLTCLKSFFFFFAFSSFCLNTVSQLVFSLSKEGSHDGQTLWEQRVRHHLCNPDFSQQIFFQKRELVIHFSYYMVSISEKTQSQQISENNHIIIIVSYTCRAILSSFFSCKPVKPDFEQNPCCQPDFYYSVYFFEFSIWNVKLEHLRTFHTFRFCAWRLQNKFLCQQKAKQRSNDSRLAFAHE